MKNTKSTLLLFFLILSFSSCKKETTRHKIMDKVYDIESFTIDGIDSTIVAKTKPGYSYMSFITDDFGDQSIKLYPCTCNNFSGDIGVHGSWSLNNKILTLDFLGQPTYSTGPFYSGEVVNWNIIQVSTDQLWLEVVFQGKNCNLHLTTKL